MSEHPHSTRLFRQDGAEGVNDGTQPDQSTLKTLDSSSDCLPPAPPEQAPALAIDALTTKSGNNDSNLISPSAPSLPGYEILEVLGRGGMGIVYKARQTKLNRLVALKMILVGSYASLEQQARFRTEAEAVARLQHPNIVQIHEVGEHEGISYFSLEFVAGGTLAQKLAGTPMPPEAAARLVESLALAMHMAHQRGIVHRDLKPSNVLITFDGVAKITDFGLAKILDEVDVQTLSGAVMGTPSYMAPEQASGIRQPISPAVDVYSLGAILYETLTGRPPFRAATALDTLRQVTHEEPVAPRRLQSTVPADLQTICLKCLQKEPGKRYASGKDLADDLRRFLENKPIRARPVSLWVRGVKLVRRKPVWAAFAGVTLAAVICLVLGGAWYSAQLRSALEDATHQREDAHIQRKRAERLQDRTYEQLKSISELAYQKVRDVPKLDSARLEIMQKTMALDQELLDEDPTNPTLRFNTAKDLERLAEIYDLLGQKDKGEEACLHALDLLKPLAEEFPSLPEYEFRLAETLIALGVIQREKDSKEASKSYHQAIEHLDALSARFPDDHRYPKRTAIVLNNWGNILKTDGKYEDARAAFEKSIKIQRKLEGQFPGYDSPEARSCRSALALACGNLAIVLRKQKKYQEAFSYYEEAINTGRNLKTYCRDFPEYQIDLARTLLNRGNLWTDKKEFAKAKDDCAEAVDLLQVLSTGYKGVPQYKLKLGQAHCALGLAWGRMKEYKKVDSEFQTGAALLQELANQSGKTQPVYWQHLAEVQANYASWLREDGRLDDSHKFLDIAIENQGKAVAAAKDNAGFKESLNSLFWGLAETQLDQHNYREAVTTAAKALKNPDSGGKDHHQAAGCLARCAAQAEKDSTASETERANLGQAYAQSAISHLKTAIDMGLKDAEALENDKNLDSLRSRPDFQEQLARLK
jgi:tetratricopeptide (TPR) repeat protein/tRNA A-37 threonylcarbamoyl transferase component Bud32